MAATRGSTPKYGLRWLFLLVSLVAVFIRLSLWIDAKSNPRSDFHGNIALADCKPAANVRVYIRETVGELTEEDRLELERLEEKSVVIEEPSVEDEGGEEAEEEDEDKPLTPADITPGMDSDYATETNAAGEYSFSQLKQGHHYIIWTEDDNWVGPSIKVVAETRKQRLSTLRLTEGGIVKFKIWHLQFDSLYEHPMVFGSSGPSHPDRPFPRRDGFENAGLAELRLPPGINRIFSGQRMEALTSEGVGSWSLTTSVSDGSTQSYRFGYDVKEGVLIPIVENSSNGHFYMLFEFKGSRQEAMEKAASLSYESMQAHLVTITDEQEEHFLRTTFRDAKSWTAGARTAEDQWEWSSGPEKGVVISKDAAYQNWKEQPTLSEDRYMVWCKDWWTREKGTHITSHLIVEFSPLK